jgi:hypothetical protein
MFFLSRYAPFFFVLSLAQAQNTSPAAETLITGFENNITVLGECCGLEREHGLVATAAIRDRAETPANDSESGSANFLGSGFSIVCLDCNVPASGR